MNNCYMYVTHHYLLGSLLIGTGYALYMTHRYSLILAMLSTWLAATHWAFLRSLHDLPLLVGTCYALYIIHCDLLHSLHYSLGLATLFMWLVAIHRNLLRSSRDLLLFIRTPRVKLFAWSHYNLCNCTKFRHVYVLLSHQISRLYRVISPQPQSKLIFTTLTLMLPLENGQQLQNTFFIYTFFFSVN